MRILLISANTEMMNMPTIPVGLGCLAEALSQEGHRVRLLDLLVEKDPLGAVRSALAQTPPGLIGISLRNIDDQNMQTPRFLLEGAKAVVSCCRRNARAPVVLGGAGYSIFPRACLEYLDADFGIQGEGEAAMCALADAIQAGETPNAIPGVFSRDRKEAVPPERIRNLGRFPLPAPQWFPVSRYRAADMWLPFQTRRGCPLKCSYCSTPAIEGTRIRRRSVDAALDSLRRWVDAGFRQVFFVDNTFNLPPSFARRLCARLADERLGLSWRAIVYPGGVDKDLVRDMARAGCREVSLGFESGDPQMLAAMNKRFGPEDIREAGRLFAGNGIRQMGFLLLGGPGETRASVERSLAFVDGLELDAVKLTVGIRIYPQTRVADIAREKGMIDAEDDLLFPRFYLEPGLEDWLPPVVEKWAEHRPNWFC
jgi:radical SAM superfamily enzyme YgiQ (UPF0313 family)